MFRWKKRIYSVDQYPKVTTASSANNILLEEPKNNAWYHAFPYKLFLGFFYTTLASFFILLTSVLVKKLTYISPGQLSMIRNLGVLVGCLPIAIYKVGDVLGPREYWFFLVVRSFLGATALYLNLMAYRFLPLAVASIIMSSVPSLVMITARLYLKEPCGLVPSLAVAVTITGVLLSIRLPELLKDTGGVTLSNPDYLTGLGCAFSCILILSITFVALRKMKDIHFSVVLVYFGAIGAIENGTLTHFLSGYSLPQCGWDAVLMMLVGVFGFAGHCFLVMAIQAEEAGIVSVIKSSTDIIISLILQVIFFDLTPDIYNMGGAALVIFSVSMIGFRKWLMNLPKDSSKRKKLKFFLL
ncbi:solute carrier family 35 member G1 [Nephila pilipes]|uniref:Solute carrier family 35 member G1 n=1 Tax=Nephila pilipes TaxID=299642 RepID=A0A8X6PXI0_NEPPI|nr:solute carrier family 35 member G1 [Nephila pilipes]